MPTFPQMQVRSGHILLLRNSGVALGESAQHAPSFRCCLCRQSRAALLPSGDGSWGGNLASPGPVSLFPRQRSRPQKRKTRPAQRETGSNDASCSWWPSTGPAVSEGQQTPGPQMVGSLNGSLFLPRLAQVQFPAIATRRFLTSLEASLPPWP